MSSEPLTRHDLPEAAHRALEEIVNRVDPTILGIVLTGSVVRDMATRFSDVDVIVVRKQTSNERMITRSFAIDEIPMSLEELELIRPIGTEGAWVRSSLLWAEVLRDQTDGRISAALDRQATLTDAEIHDLLVGRSRLDEFVNFAYRSLKSHRNGRPEAARLDSAESVASLLDIAFALVGRVRPYNKYLEWELREHPLALAEWDGPQLLGLVESMLAGSKSAMLDAFATVDRLCREHDEQLSRIDLGDVIDDWEADQLELLRGKGAGSL